MTPNRYHPSLRVLHWSIATLVIAALLLGTFVMAPTQNSDPGKVFLLLKHMLAGGLILVLTLVRLFVRPKTKRPAPVLSGIAMADRIVPYVHRLFDLLVFVMVGSGIGIAILSGLPGIVFGGHGTLPSNFNHLPLHTLHVVVARVFVGFVALHVVGAFYHQFVLKDRLLSRMSIAVGRNR